MCLCLIISLVSALVFLVSVIFKLDRFVLLLVVWFRLLVSSVFVSVFVGFWVIMLDMCLLAGIYVSKIFVMAWLQMLQNSLEQCNMSLLIVCVEMMQISSLCSKLEKFVLLFVLLFLFLGYNYKKKKKKMRLLSFDTLFCSIEILKKKKSCDFFTVEVVCNNFLGSKWHYFHGFSLFCTQL